MDRRLGRERPADAARAAVERQQVRALAAEEHRVSGDHRLRSHRRHRRQCDGPGEFQATDVVAVDAHAFGCARIVATEAPVRAPGHRHRGFLCARLRGDPRVALCVLVGGQPLGQLHALLLLQHGRLRLHLAELHRHQDVGSREPAQRVGGRSLGLGHLVADRAGRLVQRGHVFRGAGTRMRQARHREQHATGEMERNPGRAGAG